MRGEMDRRHERKLTLVLLLAALGFAAGSASASFSSSTSTSASSTATFGRTTVGTLQNLASNRKRVSRFVLGEAGAVSHISAYVDGNGSRSSSSQVVRYVIYADKGGKPAALLGATGSHRIARRARAAWVTLALPTALALKPGTYHLGIHSGSSSYVGRYAAVQLRGGLKQNDNSFTSGPKNPFGSASTVNLGMSIYATYTSAPANTAPPTTEPAADTQPPTLPPGLTMTGATDSTISIAWAASADDVGVAGYRLYRDGVAVATTTQTTYTFAGLACGTSYALAYEAFDAAGNMTNRNEATTVRSTTTCPVPAPSNTGPPAISGSAQVAQLLSASQGSWTGSPTSYAFQWLRCDSAGASCSRVSGATSSTYMLTSADEGRTLRVELTATNSAGSATAVSSPTAVVQAAPTPSPETGLANLWVHPQQSGSCTRSAIPGAYDAATACASFAAAYTAANQTTDASLVLVRGGTYTAGLTLTGARSSANRITLRSAPGEAPEFSGDLLRVGDGTISTAPSYMTIDGMTGAQFGPGTTCPDCRYGVHVRTGSDHIRVQDSTLGMVMIWGSEDIEVVGNDLGPCRARTASTASTVQNEAGCSFNKVDNFGARPTRITYENNVMHDYDLTQSCFSVANGGTNTAGQPDCHWRPFWCIGCEGLTFRGNVVRDSKEGPALANTGGGAATGTRNVLIENNYFGPGLNWGPGGGTWGGRNYGNSGGFEIGWCSANVLDYDNIVYRFNSHYRNSGVWFHQAGAGNLCDDDELTNVFVYGNVGSRSACRAFATYRNNVHTNTGTCDASETKIASGTIPFYRNETPTPDADDYDLVGAANVTDNFVPTNVLMGCPATDRLGNVRGVGGSCDAGAYER